VTINTYRHFLESIIDSYVILYQVFISSTHYFAVCNLCFYYDKYFTREGYLKGDLFLKGVLYNNNNNTSELQSQVKTNLWAANS